MRMVSYKGEIEMKNILTNDFASELFVIPNILLAFIADILCCTIIAIIITSVKIFVKGLICLLLYDIILHIEEKIYADNITNRYYNTFMVIIWKKPH